MASNSFTGNIILSLTLSVFIYYVFWVSILPFLLLSNEDNWIYGLFPPEAYAFLIPAVFGIVFIGGLSAFTLYQIKGVGGTLF